MSPSQCEAHWAGGAANNGVVENHDPRSTRQWSNRESRFITTSDYDVRQLGEPTISIVAMRHLAMPGRGSVDVSSNVASDREIRLDCVLT
jgi:hypothetical protein